MLNMDHKHAVPFHMMFHFNRAMLLYFFRGWYCGTRICECIWEYRRFYTFKAKVPVTTSIIFLTAPLVPWSQARLLRVGSWVRFPGWPKVLLGFCIYEFLSSSSEFGSWRCDTPVSRKARKAVGPAPDLSPVVWDCRPIGL